MVIQLVGNFKSFFPSPLDCHASKKQLQIRADRIPVSRSGLTGVNRLLQPSDKAVLGPNC